MIHMIIIQYNVNTNPIINNATYYVWSSHAIINEICLQVRSIANGQMRKPFMMPWAFISEFVFRSSMAECVGLLWGPTPQLNESQGRVSATHIAFDKLLDKYLLPTHSSVASFTWRYLCCWPIVLSFAKI